MDGFEAYTASSTSSNLESSAGSLSVDQENQLVLRESPSSAARRARGNTVPGHASFGGVPVYIVWRSPVDDAERV